jgi:hypothetical protein
MAVERLDVKSRPDPIQFTEFYWVAAARITEQLVAALAGVVHSGTCQFNVQSNVAQLLFFSQ